MSESPWRPSDRADPAALPLADRHYNRQHPGSQQWVPPATCICLKTIEVNPETGEPWGVWSTTWPKEQYVRHAWAGAWVNATFRLEGGPYLASNLIGWAVAHTRAKWPAVPPLGIVSFVDAAKTRRKRDPGRCYRKAGWVHVGFTKSGLWVFEQREQSFEGLRGQISEPMPALASLSQLALFGGEVA